MDAVTTDVIIYAAGTAMLGSVLFFFIGLIAGTSETATIAPATLLVVLLGAPPEACFSFCIAAIIAKHITHAVPTAMLGIPGDAMAVPLLEPCGIMRKLGVPHVALQKMISAGVIASLLVIPASVLFGAILAQFFGFVKDYAGLIFIVVAVVLAFFSKARWANLVILIPFALVIFGLNQVALKVAGKKLVICMFMGLAMGPMMVDLLCSLVPNLRKNMETDKPREAWLAPPLKNWKGYLPNPLKMLTRRQKMYSVANVIVSCFLFTFSAVGVTIIIGEWVRKMYKSAYARASSMAAIMNGATESTYLAEVIIPLVAFGLPLSPIAMGVGLPLFNAPPVFTTEPMHNLHTLMTPMTFLFFGMLAAIVASILIYPLAMNYARPASYWVSKNISQEAILGMFAGLIIVLAYFEAGWIGVFIAFTMGFFGGILGKFFSMNIGVQFMIFYASPHIVRYIWGVS